MKNPMFGIFLNKKDYRIIHLYVDENGEVLGSGKYDLLKYYIKIKLISKLTKEIK